MNYLEVLSFALTAYFGFVFQLAGLEADLRFLIRQGHEPIEHILKLMNLYRTIRLPFLCMIMQFLMPFSLSFGQGRMLQSINTSWQFHKGELPSAFGNPATWIPISLPHTWNASDVNDEIPGYYRGTGWYKKQILIPSSYRSKDVYLQFEGANQFTEVFVNGKKAAEHTGGYTAFNVNISPYLNFEANAANEILVKVDNSHNEDIPPLSADFTFFGGIYRDVYLTAVDKIHFNLDDYGSGGIFISTPLVSEQKAKVVLRGSVRNTGSSNAAIWIVSTIKDQNGTVVSRQKSKLRASGLNAFEQNFPDIPGPELWSPGRPYLYSVSSIIQDIKTGAILDEVSHPLGFRWFKFDAAQGFFLNGKPLKLVGASRHQDFKGRGNALPDAMQVRDVELLKEMGANFLRVAHYPQDRAVLEACDRLGILASVEIPIVNAITETEAFSENCKRMQVEMIRQNFNHPSVIIWAYMNEVLLRPRFAKDSIRQEIYFKNLAVLTRQLEGITRKEDPARYTLIPNHGNFSLYHRVGLTQIPMLVGWNLYQGWYSGKLTEFAEFLDMHRKMLPDKPLLVTEYGSDADIRLHSDSPERFDKSVEYTRLYHEEYLKAMMNRPFVAAAIAWNLADFSSEDRRETDPHVNNKGLLTIDRTPKDTYYFYQANLLKQPFLKIGSGDQLWRSGLADAENRLLETITVYSNQPEVALSLNGIGIGEKPTQQGIALFKVKLSEGVNILEASVASAGKVYGDRQVLNARLIPANLSSKELPFRELNVSLGDRRRFYDKGTNQVWLPEREYTPGSWGYLGGLVYKMADTARQSFGTTKDILGTALDPIYQTQRVGLKEFIADVPDGNYEVILHFAELQSNKPEMTLAYNLGKETGATEGFKARNFDVTINGIPAIRGLGSNNYLSQEQAFSFKTTVNTRGNKGIRIRLLPVTGETILNGIQIKRKF